MLCPECRRYNDDDRVVCAYCGKVLEHEMPDAEEEELMRFRQGRHLRQQETQGDEQPRRHRRSGGASRAFEDPMPPENPETTGAIYGQSESLANTGFFYGDDEMEIARAEQDRQERYDAAKKAVPVDGLVKRRSRTRRARMYQKAVNWAHVTIAVFILMIVSTLGFLLFLRNTQTGQVWVARWGYDANADALWTVGEECFDRGEVNRAIECFTAAREKNKEAGEPNAEGLMLLGEAYEAQGNLPAAEEVYAYVYTTVQPTLAEAYRAQVRVLREQGRDAEAAALLQIAYQQTGQPTFRSQRLDILPAIPTVDVPGGYYTERKSVQLLQLQEYSIVYTFNPLAVLPQDGILYEGPIELGEGEHELRAVAVYGDLVSDPIKVTYQIYMPTPLSPEANLAPGTYNSPRTNVRLWKRELSKEELEKK